ncbi:DUF417 family protein [Elizabethkingia meningoseptica]|uniref:DUF417 family protein n=1 Tax=Elizabethkingia meningoseptica TaxID=238 RepID=UPI0020137799|nr:DUF417 family protein [Elizabethkingia meningoseptica]MCL1676970.1 YkgB family protein [Elizabethkingia meningoseptica]MCL1685113.1 YkgB family protein [Elizabethkingia meningoseptica]MDE5493744.1 YkgB family protein [Elizabethkingia meningoseptica]
MFTKTLQTSTRIFLTGYYISLYGIALVLLWIGIFKFTPTEAASIKPLVENHLLMGWLYHLLSVQGVSNLIGIVEIITSISIVFAPYRQLFRTIASAGILVTFITTLSFLLTTPGMWKIVDGIPVTDFFILKDLVSLGFGLMILQFPKYTTK